MVGSSSLFPSVFFCLMCSEKRPWGLSALDLDTGMHVCVPTTTFTTNTCSTFTVHWFLAKPDTQSHFPIKKTKGESEGMTEEEKSCEEEEKLAQDVNAPH